MKEEGYWAKRLEEIDIPFEEAFQIMAAAYIFLQTKYELALEGKELCDVASGDNLIDALECIDAAGYIIEPLADHWDKIVDNLPNKN